MLSEQNRLESWLNDKFSHFYWVVNDVIDSKFDAKRSFVLILIDKEDVLFFESSFVEEIVFWEKFDIPVNILFLSFGNDEDILIAKFFYGQLDTDDTIDYKIVFQCAPFNDDPTKIECYFGWFIHFLFIFIKEFYRSSN